MKSIGVRLARLFSSTRGFRFQSLLVRNALLAFALVLIPLIVVGALSFRSIDRNVRSAIDELNAATSVRVRDTIDAALRDSNRIAATLVLEDETWAFFRGITGDETEFPVRGSVLDLVTRFENIYPYMDSIYIYSESTGTVLDSSGVTPFVEFADSDWISFYRGEYSSRLQLVSRKKQDVYPYLISGIRREFSQDGTRLGAVVVNIDVETLARIISVSNVAGVQEIYIVGEDDRILLHHDRNRIGSELDSVPLLASVELAGAQETVMQSVDGRSYSVSFARSTYTPLTYVVTLPHDLQIHRLAAARFYLATATVVAVFAAAIIALLVAAVSYKPVSDVIRFLTDPDSYGALQERGSAEVRFIAEKLTSVIHSNRVLRDEVETRLGLLHNAQVAMLQAQINPHFLYNSLEGINWLAIRANGGENNVSKAVTDLSDLLRYSLERDTQFASVEEEVRIAKAYLAMMEIRYPERWVTSWSVAADVHAHEVPRMILQPLLENAIQHGIVPMERAGRIEVRVRSRSTELEISVVDNGTGMSDEEREALIDTLHNEGALESSHIGVWNVHRRICLLFSNEYGVEIDSGPAGETVVRVRIPARQISTPSS